MAQFIKILIICANVALLRLACATQVDQDTQQQWDSVSNGSIAALESINSLDFSRKLESASPVEAPTGTPARRRAKAAAAAAHQGGQQQSMSDFLVDVLARLEKVDIGRALAESLGSVGKRARQQQRRTASISAPAQSPQNGTQHSLKDGKLNVSALTAETGNLLSITKQLVKLARNQVFTSGNDFLAGPSGWPGALSPSFPSMLSAASNAFHHSLAFEDQHHQQAMGKSDWFWLVAPAVIVVGAGVIVVPLIAAYLVSNAMAQNTFTVSAGRRRRRKREVDGRHSLDLMRLLDLHQLLDDAPRLLVEKLSRFHEALDTVGRGLVGESPGGAAGWSAASRAKGAQPRDE